MERVLGALEFFQSYREFLGHWASDFATP
jgi:hypothetical protein